MYAMRQRKDEKQFYKHITHRAGALPGLVVDEGLGVVLLLPRFNIVLHLVLQAVLLKGKRVVFCLLKKI